MLTSLILSHQRQDSGKNSRLGKLQRERDSLLRFASEDKLLIPFSYYCGGDVPKFEPKKWFKFKDIDKSIRELRAMFKVHPEWFETPKLKSDKSKNEVDYS